MKLITVLALMLAMTVTPTFAANSLGGETGRTCTNEGANENGGEGHRICTKPNGQVIRHHPRPTRPHGGGPNT